MTEHLVEWDGLDLRVDGTRLRDVAAAMMARSGAHIEDLAFRFRPGELTVSGKVRKVLPLPFRVVIRNIDALGRTVRVRLEEIAALGVIPIPSILTRLVGNRQAAEGVVYQAESNALVIQLDRFLPTFLDVELAEIRILEGGLAVRLGRGGADLPPFP
jgi:hypothetical protein